MFTKGRVQTILRSQKIVGSFNSILISKFHLCIFIQLIKLILLHKNSQFCDDIVMKNSNRFSAKQFFKEKLPKPSQTKQSKGKVTTQKQKINAKAEKIQKQSEIIDDKIEVIASSLTVGLKIKTIDINAINFKKTKRQQQCEKQGEESNLTADKKRPQCIKDIKQAKQKQPSKQEECEVKTITEEKFVRLPKKCRAKIFNSELIDKIPLQNKTSLHRWRYGQGTTSSKLVIGTWNVNGIRSVMSKKMLYPYIHTHKPDIICITETKADQKNFDSSPITLNGYHGYWNFPKHSSGYSGVAIFSKFLPKSATEDMLQREHSQEGRILTLQFQAFMLINIYVPTVGKELQRSDYRKRFDTAFREHVNRVRIANPSKPVIIVGDLNAAHTQLDTHPGKQIMLTPSFTTIERQGFQELLNMGYTDVYRALHPGVRAYTWWYVNIGGRDRLDTPGLGRRIDYILMPTEYMKWVKRCDILREYFGADHCPVQIEIDLQL